MKKYDMMVIFFFVLLFTSALAVLGIANDTDGTEGGFDPFEAIGMVDVSNSPIVARGVMTDVNGASFGRWVAYDKDSVLMLITSKELPGSIVASFNETVPVKTDQKRETYALQFGGSTVAVTGKITGTEPERIVKEAIIQRFNSLNGTRPEVSFLIKNLDENRAQTVSGKESLPAPETAQARDGVSSNQPVAEK